MLSFKKDEKGCNVYIDNIHAATLTHDQAKYLIGEESDAILNMTIILLVYGKKFEEAYKIACDRINALAEDNLI